MAGKKKGFVFLLILFMSIFSLDVLFVQMQNSRYTHQGNGGKENSIALTISELDFAADEPSSWEGSNFIL